MLIKFLNIKSAVRREEREREKNMFSRETSDSASRCTYRIRKSPLPPPNLPLARPEREERAVAIAVRGELGRRRPARPRDGGTRNFSWLQRAPTHPPTGK